MFAPEDGWVVKASFVAAPGEFVSLKLALLAPVAPALTVYDPATVFAVKVVEVACPLLALVAVVVVVELAKVPDAPLDGAVKVTVTPGTAFPWASLTIATSWLENAALTVADCPEPETTVTALAGPYVSVIDAELLVAVHDCQYAVARYL